MESSSLKRLGTRSLAITSSAAMLVGLTAAGAAAAPTAPLASEDTDAPNLVSFEVDPTEYNLDEGEAVIKVTAKITDATGVDRTTEDGDPIDPVLFAQSTSSSHRSDNIALDLVAGTATDGTYEGTLTIPVGSAAGDWQINLVSLGDTLGNEVAAADKENVGAFSLRYNEVIELTSAYDFFQDETGTDNDSFTIPDLEGVEFYVDGVFFAPGRYTGQAVGSVNIVAYAEDDYEFSEDLDEVVEDSGEYVSEGLDFVSEDGKTASWTHEFNMVTPADVQFIDRSGSAGDAYVIPDVEGVSYYLAPITEGEEALEAGEHVGLGSVTLVAVADEGYELAAEADTEWSYAFGTGYEDVVEGDVAVSGDAQVGVALTAVTEDNPATDAKWGPEAGVEFSYQWFAEVVDEDAATGPVEIEGATGATFTPTLDQLGKTISVEVIGSLEGYEPSEAVTSASTGAVAEGYLTAATPAINGDAEVGETLTAEAGAWGQEGVELAYQWNADGEAIEGATGSTLELTEENLGQRISVTVTGSLENYKDTSVTSAVTAEVVEAVEGLTFSDVSEGQWFFSPVMWMVDNEITTGYTDGTFKPYNPVTRGEAVTFLYRYAADEDFTAPEESGLIDVPPTHNFFEAISWATQNGVVNGYTDDTFRSGHNMTRGQVAAILYRQAEPEHTAPEESPFTDLTPESNQYEAITWLAENDITTGRTDGTFDPYANVTRAEIATFLERYNRVLNG